MASCPKCGRCGLSTRKGIRNCPKCGPSGTTPAITQKQKENELWQSQKENK